MNDEAPQHSLQRHVDRIVEKKRAGVPLNEAERRFWGSLRSAALREMQTPEARTAALSSAQEKRARRAAKRIPEQIEGGAP